MSTKTIQVTLSDFKKVNEILQKVKTHGVSYMRIAELKNKDLNQIKKQVRIDAIKDAKEKAAYLIESLGNTIGQVLTIKEVDTNPASYMSAEELHNAQTLSNNGQNNTTGENVVLKYVVKVKFEIK